LQKPIVTEAETTAARLLRPAYRNYVLAMVAIGIGFSFLDRQIVNILLPAIKADLHVSDTMLGVMSGLAFAVIYAGLGVPLARVADRRSRRDLMAAAILVWSGMSVLAGLVRTFPQLVLARFGVGIGEAGYSPAGFSMISDYFPRHRRQTAAAIVNIGPQIGMMVGLVIGGLVAPVWGWRAAFFVAGAPGLLFAIVFRLTVQEPIRGMADGAAPAEIAQPPFLPTLATLWRIRSYRYVILAEAMFSFATFAQQTWFPSLLFRSHGMALRSVGLELGVTTAVAGVLGTALSGILGDRLARRDIRLALILPALAGIIGCPLMAAADLAPTGQTALLFYGLAYVVVSLQIGPLFALTQTTTPIAARAFGLSILLLLTALVGMGLGPPSVGLISDHLGHASDPQALRDAMALMSLAFLVPALLSGLAALSLKSDIRALESAE
jgi:MFS family permease